MLTTFLRHMFQLNRLHKNLYNYGYRRGYSLSAINSYELTFENVSLTNYVNNLIKEYEELKSKGTINERFHDLNEIMNLLDERKTLVGNIINLKDLLQETDIDLKKLADEEKNNYESKIQVIDENLQEMLLFDKEETDSLILELNAGVGGQEAMLFTSELFEMYCNYIDHKGWDQQVLEYTKTDIGGIRHGSLLVNGHLAFKHLKYEGGVHRVQRIPATEKAGRIHTSTVSVLALPQPTDIQVNLNNKDLQFETKRASGAGGQHVNTTDSAVRVLHIPTGISVECQSDRSQIKNKELALQRLKSKLYQIQLDKQTSDTEAIRKSQVKSNFRNEKIRTYNFNQDRVTDHRLRSCNYHNLKIFMEGGEPLDSLINKLYKHLQKERLLQILSEYN